MVCISYQERDILLDQGETVLDALLRSGFNIPHGCKSGVCQSCVLAAVEGEPPAVSQQTLKASLIAQGCFLSCSCVPKSNLKIRDEVYLSKYPAVVSRIERSFDVLLLTLISDNFQFHAGQYLTLWRNEQHARCYSIASASNSKEISLHIKLVQNGAVSSWLANNIEPGDQLEISGPHGDCIYQKDKKDANILLLGIGTGLAPLYGIIQDALANQHQGNIDLVCAAKSADGLYLKNELLEMEKNTDKLKIHLLCQNNNSSTSNVEQSTTQADVYDWVKQHYPSTKDYLIYLCGSSNFVQKLRKICFLAGANSRDIFADIFAPFNSASTSAK